MFRSRIKGFVAGRTGHIRRPNRLRLVALEDRVVPTQFVVTNTADSGAGSLRQAVLDANAAVGTDEVIFDATIFSSPQTITLTSGAITVSTGALTITGPGTKLATISGNNASGIFEVSGPGTTFSGLTMTQGESDEGGAIFANSSPLTIQNCDFLSNEADDGGAVFSQYADLTIDSCVFRANHGVSSGAVVVDNPTSFSTKSVTIRNSTFVNNTITYFDGGGLSLSGYLNVKVENSAFIANTTGLNGVGGAISIGTYEYGYFKSNVTTLRNCTFSNNRAAQGGAVYVIDNICKSLAIQNCTIVDNEAVSAGGGLFVPADGAVSIESSIISRNTASNQQNDIAVSPFASTIPISIKASAIGSSNGFPISDMGGNLPFGTNLKLGLLTDNGGSTLTRMPAPTSPLINAGTNPAILTTDQRGVGFPRQIGSAVDIGSVEGDGLAPVAQPPEFTPVTQSGATSHEIVVEYYGASAIDIGSIGVGDVRVTGPNGFDVLAGLKSTTGSPNAVTATYVFTPPNGSWDVSDVGDYTVTLNDGQVSDTDSRPVKGGQLGVQRVLISRNLVVSNDADDGPGSLREAFREATRIAPSADSITFDPAFFSVTRTITLTSGPLTTNDSTFLVGPGANLLTIKAGAGRAMEFTYSFDRGNEAVIEGIKISGDLALPASGGISFYGKSFTVRNAVIAGNKAAAGKGSGVHVSATNVMVDGCQIANNQGIGLFIDHAQIATVQDCIISGNSGGSGLMSFYCRQTFVDGTTISNNSAVNGGGITMRANASDYIMKVVNSTVSGNTASSGGGGIYSRAGVVNLINSTITSNSANIGGGFYSTGAVVALESSIFAVNQASDGPDIKSGAKVTSKNSALGSSTGYTLTDLGGNLPVGIDLKLAPLANNGGPTPTHALLPDSPAINGGSNPAGLSTDQRGTGFYRVIGKSADIGAFEYQNLPAVISSVQVNDGSPQRSRVTSLKITFDRPVAVNANSFQLIRQSDGAPVSLSASVLGSSVTLTFTGGPVEFGSLADGRYTLTAFAALINGGSFDGNGDTVTGDNYVLVGSPGNGLFRLFGDADGDGHVNSNDFTIFRTAFGLGASVFDFNNDGQTNSNDFAEFRKRFGMILP